MSRQLGALVATHLFDRRRSLWAWGIPLGVSRGRLVACALAAIGAWLFERRDLAG